MNRSSEVAAQAQARANTWGFALVFVVVNLHVLRNIASAPYLGVYALTSMWVLNRALVRLRTHQAFTLGLPLAWLAAAGIAFASTLAISGAAVAAYGLARYLFALPILLAFIAYTTQPGDLKRHVRTMCIFFAIGSLSIPLQYLTGPIRFFAAASERAGLERYASIFGSLTALGISAGSYIALTQTLKIRSTVMTVVAISVGGIASLSKAAIANIALGLVSHLVTGGRRTLRLLITLIVVIVVGYAVVRESTLLQESLAASATSFGIEGGTTNYDMSFQSSLIDRLVDKPAANFAVLATLGPSAYLTGGGFGMGSTALVPESASLAEMTHNQFAEFFSIGGALGATITCLTLLTILHRLLRTWRATRSSLHGSIFAALALWVGNSFFANGTAYQPIAASIIFLAMFVAMQREGEDVIGDSDATPEHSAAASGRQLSDA